MHIYIRSADGRVTVSEWNEGIRVHINTIDDAPTVTRMLVRNRADGGEPFDVIDICSGGHSFNLYVPVGALPGIETTSVPAEEAA